MASFTIISADIGGPPAFIQDNGVVDDGCIGDNSITVIGASIGNEKHVEIFSDTVYGSPNLTQIISANQPYNLIIEADNSGPPTVTTTMTVIVRDQDAFGPIEDTHQYIRQHTVNIC